MNRLLRLILVIVMLTMCYGCFIPGRGWVVPGDEVQGDHDRGDHGDRDRGGHDNRDGGRHNEQERH